MSNDDLATLRQWAKDFGKGKTDKFPYIDISNLINEVEQARAAKEEPVYYSITCDGEHCGNLWPKKDDAIEATTRLNAKHPESMRAIVPLFAAPQALPAAQPETRVPVMWAGLNMNGKVVCANHDKQACDVERICIKTPTTLVPLYAGAPEPK